MSDTHSAQAIVDRLAAVPQWIAAVVEDWDTEQLRASVDGEWSAAAILAHIRASDDILAYRAYALLAKDQPPLITYDERCWADVARYADLDFRASLTLFTLKRAELVNMLCHISAEQWQRVGIHEFHGAMPLSTVLLGLLEHEEEHCEQLKNLVAK